MKQGLLSLLSKVAFGTILLVAIFFRVWHLSWIPGINGDEAWYGMVAHSIVTGAHFPKETPNGNPINFFFMLPHVLLAWFARPSFFALRVPALLAGLATIFAAYKVSKRILGHGLAAALLMACLPIAIAYSRFSWDPCESALACWLFLAACFEMSLIWTLLSLLVALTIHQTNIFILLAGFTLAAHGVYEDRKTIKKYLLLVAANSALALTFVKLSADTGGDSFLNISFLRIFDWREWQMLLGAVGRFLFGATMEQYIVEPSSTTTLFWQNWIASPLFYILLFAGLIFAWQKRDAKKAAPLLGFFVSLLGLIFVINGGRPFRPNYERYGIFLLAPAVLASASALDLCFRDLKKPIAVLASALALVSWLFWFEQHYFAPILQTGGESHRTFRTVNPEPKSAAYTILQHEAGSEPNLSVLVESWWLHAPLTYLNKRDVPMNFIQSDLQTTTIETCTQVLSAHGFLVSFAGSPFDQMAAEATKLERGKSWLITDPLGRPLISVYRAP